MGVADRIDTEEGVRIIDGFDEKWVSQEEVYSV